MRIILLAAMLTIALGGCAKMQADKREAMLRRMYDHHGVMHKPYALDDRIKQECHSRIRSEIIVHYTHPESWDAFKELAPMEKATHAYALQTGYTMPDEGKPEEPYSTEHTVFYMTKYLGEDFVGNGTDRRYVCTVKADTGGLHLEAVSTIEGFRRVMNLPVAEPAAW